MRNRMLHTIFTLTVKWIILFSIVQCSVFACPCVYGKMEPCFAEMTEVVIAGHSMSFLGLCSDAENFSFFVGCDAASLGDW